MSVQAASLGGFRVFQGAQRKVESMVVRFIALYLAGDSDVRTLVGDDVASGYFIAMSINLARLAWLFGKRPQEDALCQDSAGTLDDLEVASAR